MRKWVVNNEGVTISDIGKNLMIYRNTGMLQILTKNQLNCLENKHI